MARKVVVVAVAAALVGFLVASLAGCGSGQSPGDLTAGADRTIKANWKAVGELNSRTDSLISWLSGVLSSGGGIDQGGFDDEVEKARERVREISDGYRAAGKEYQRVIDMEGGEAYSAYAQLKVLEIAQVDALMNEMESFLIRVSERIERTGLEPAWFDAAVHEYQDRYTEVFDEIIRLAASASAARKGKKPNQ